MQPLNHPTALPQESAFRCWLFLLLMLRDIIEQRYYGGVCVTKLDRQDLISYWQDTAAKDFDTMINLSISVFVIQIINNVFIKNAPLNLPVRT